MMRQRDGKDEGFALILVLVIMMTLTVFSVGVIISTGTNNALSRNFEKSTQAQFLIPMAISLGFGIMFATICTLILLPVNYLLFTRTGQMVSRLFK